MAKFLIKNSDSYGEKSFESVEGIFEKKDGTHIYKYNSKLGYCEIEATEKKIAILRGGSANFKMEIEKDKMTPFRYETELLSKDFKVRGTHIKIDEKNSLLEFAYKIYEDDFEVNTIEIGIKMY